jgi:hypothetical protein
MRKWPASCFGELKLVLDGNHTLVAEMIHTEQLPDGRSIPSGVSGPFFSVLGTNDVVPMTPSMELCDPCQHD